MIGKHRISEDKQRQLSCDSLLKCHRLLRLKTQPISLCGKSSLLWSFDFTCHHRTWPLDFSKMGLITPISQINVKIKYSNKTGYQLYHATQCRINHQCQLCQQSCPAENWLHMYSTQNFSRSLSVISAFDCILQKLNCSRLLK